MTLSKWVLPAAAWLALGAVPAESAGVPSPAAVGERVHACVHIDDLSNPLAAGERLQTVAPQDRRGRLVAVLRQEAQQKGAPLLARLRKAGANDARLLWGAGVVCGTASRAEWEAVAAMPGAGAFFEDPPQRDEALSTSTTGPNRNVPPEAPLVALHVPEAWDEGFTGRDVVVALIDTGVDISHPDLAAQIWTNRGEIPGNGIDDDGNGYIDDVHGYNFVDGNGDVSDPFGHGTNSAGLVAGNGAGGKQTGVAPGVQLMVLRRGLTEAALWETSQYAIENGAQVICQTTAWAWSLSPRPDYAGWRRQADAELAAGILHVNSAGNLGLSQGTDPVPYNISAPGNCPPPWLPPDQNPRGGVSSMVAVGNVDTLSLAIVSTSAYGPAEWTDIKARRDSSYPYSMPPAYQDYPDWGGSTGLVKPDLVAQGDNSTTTDLGGGYITNYSGTSAAAPRVAGIVALMKQAVPTATPAELYQALVTTARDLGAPGRDSRYGAGLPDAIAAIGALGPALFVVSTQVLDGGPPRGDGDGGADAGEIDRLAVTIQNTSAQPLSGVDLLLSAVSNVVVRDGYIRLDSVPSGGTIATAAPHFGIEFPAGSCGLTAELRLEIRQGGKVRVEPLLVPVGSETRTILQSADFETDPGFAVSGTATAGAWVRAIPVGTVKNGQPANPPADHTPDPGAMCYVTGNGPTNPDTADVDGGRTILTSPARDARGFHQVEVSYYRWFYTSSTSGEDSFRVEATGDGTNWSTLETVTGYENWWRGRQIVVSDLVTPGAATQVRFTVEDAAPDTCVEGGLDDYALVGVSLACTPWTIPSSPAPSPVGATLRLAPAAGGHLKLTWSAPSSAGGVDPVLGYSVTRSNLKNTGFAEIGRPAVTEYVEVDGMNPATGPIRFYLVASLTPAP